MFTQFERAETSISGGALVNPGACSVRCYWDYFDSTSNAKVTATQDCYRVTHYLYPNTTYSSSHFTRIPEVVITKNKLRGTGKSLSLKFSTQAGKDCKLMGWSIPVIAETDE